MKRVPNTPDWPVRKFVITGASALFLLFAGFGSWLANANLSGAIIVPGQLTRETANSVVQHPTGGVITAILVTEGEKVAAGDTLIRLDDRTERSEMAILRHQRFELIARRAGLIAQRDALSAIQFPPDILTQARHDVELQQTLDGQVRLLETRRTSWFQRQELSAGKVSQIAVQINGINAQLDALEIQLSLIIDQMERHDRLIGKGLVTATQGLPLKRQLAVIQGKIGQAVSNRAIASAQISEIETRELQSISQRREDAIIQLRDIEFRISELSEKQNILQSRIDSADIRAPIDGIVLDLGNHGTNSVIRAAQTLMQIAPLSPPNRIQARLAASHIDQLYLAQPVDIRLSSAVGDHIPRMPGTIVGISAGTLTDPQSGAPYFRIDVAFNPPSQVRARPPTGIFAGVPADLYIQTAQQLAWAYLAKPFLNYFSRAPA